MTEEILDLKEFMDRVQNDKDLIFELLDIFVGDFQLKREELECAVKKNDIKTIEHVAHFLKGSCGNISAKSLRRILVDLEESVGKVGLADAEKYLNEIDQKYEELVIRIGELRGSL